MRSSLGDDVEYFERDLIIRVSQPLGAASLAPSSRKELAGSGSDGGDIPLATLVAPAVQAGDDAAFQVASAPAEGDVAATAPSEQYATIQARAADRARERAALPAASAAAAAALADPPTLPPPLNALINPKPRPLKPQKRT
jgi:hypothetical protein